MKGKPLEMCLLFDVYGDMLTEKQRELFDLYYNEDLSLAEIAEHAGISRQGVRDGIVRAEHTLTELESKLSLAARMQNVNEHVYAMQSIMQRLQSTVPQDLHAQLQMHINALVAS